MGTTKGLRGEQKLEGEMGLEVAVAGGFSSLLVGPSVPTWVLLAAHPVLVRRMEPTALGQHGLEFNLMQNMGMVLQFGSFTESFPSCKNTNLQLHKPQGIMLFPSRELNYQRSTENLSKAAQPHRTDWAEGTISALSAKCKMGLWFPPPWIHGYPGGMRLPPLINWP